LGTKTRCPSEVIAPVRGLDPVEIVGGESRVKSPVAGLYLYWDTWNDPLFTAYTKSSTGSTMNDTGPVPLELTGEPAIGVSVPSALGQAVVTCVHAERIVMSFEPLLATKR
jgi:hypothetical protein